MSGISGSRSCWDCSWVPGSPIQLQELSCIPDTLSEVICPMDTHLGTEPFSSQLFCPGNLSVFSSLGDFVHSTQVFRVLYRGLADALMVQGISFHLQPQSSFLLASPSMRAGCRARWGAAPYTITQRSAALPSGGPAILPGPGVSQLDSVNPGGG